MYTCTYNEFTAILDKAKKLAENYKDRYEELLDRVCSTSQIKYRTRRTVFNLKENIRPDLTSLNINMHFFDRGNKWLHKKPHLYKINKDTEGKIQSICADNDFVEFFVYEGDDIILANYTMDEISGRYMLESVGCGHFSDGLIKSFFVFDVGKTFVPEIQDHLSVEQYTYSDNKLVEVTLYSYNGNEEITLDENDKDKLGYIDLGDNMVSANPELYFDRLIYDENGSLCLIERHCPHHKNVGVAKLTIKQA